MDKSVIAITLFVAFAGYICKKTICRYAMWPVTVIFALCCVYLTGLCAPPQDNIFVTSGTEEYKITRGKNGPVIKIHQRKYMKLYGMVESFINSYTTMI